MAETHAAHVAHPAGRGLRGSEELARRAKSKDLSQLADSGLLLTLQAAAADRDFATALAAVDIAVRRRIGSWSAVLARPDALSGRIACLRRTADEIVHRNLAGPSDQSLPQRRTVEDWAAAAAARECGDSETRDAIRWLLTALVRSRSEHPPEVLLDAGLYNALEAVDDTGCLVFEPTVEQMTAAALLTEGAVVEMDAGEGKSLVAAIAAAVFASTGRRVHILTANDYLAFRDCETFAPTFESLGLTVGLAVDGMDRDEKRLQYLAHVVFTTAREVGFDYLRDNLARSTRRRVHPVFDVAIVDEADHLLIDQARTPLIISGESVEQPVVGESYEWIASELMERQSHHVDGLFERLNTEGNASEDRARCLATILLAGGLTRRLATTLEERGATAREVMSSLLSLNDEDEDRPLEQDLMFAVSAGGDSLSLTERGWDTISDRLAQPTAAFDVIQMLRAGVLHNADEDYVVNEDSITLVDRLDGRPMYSHRYMYGLHEAIENKEGAAVHAAGDARAQTTVRALIANYATVGGLTGTAVQDADTFRREYGLAAIRVPPVVRPRRSDLGARVFMSRGDLIRTVAHEIELWHGIGRPVLLSAGTVTESAAFSQALSERGVPHRVLNARNPSLENEVVAGAGRFGAVTVSTGMAARGTDVIVEPDVDARILEASANLARAKLSQGLSVAFGCASDGEAKLLLEALDTVEDANARLLKSSDGLHVCAGPRESGGNGNTRVEFGLGMIVIIASMPASERVERQIRGRTARQGRFGASMLAVYLNDPVLAFCRQQHGLMRLKEPGAMCVRGPAIDRLLREVQADSESRRRAAARAGSDFAAVIEAECRAHYAEREDLLASGRTSAWIDALISNWVVRATSDLDDVRRNYASRVESVLVDLADRYGIAIDAPAELAPSEIRGALAGIVERGLTRHRDRLGPKRLGVAVSRQYLEVIDDLWPGRLSELHDVALSSALGSTSRQAAVATFVEQVEASRSDLWARADDLLVNELLTGEHVDSDSDIDDNRVERLPIALSALLT